MTFHEQIEQAIHDAKLGECVARHIVDKSLVLTFFNPTNTDKPCFEIKIEKETE